VSQNLQLSPRWVNRKGKEPCQQAEQQQQQQQQNQVQQAKVMMDA
jgi:hypothetical protein